MKLPFEFPNFFLYDIILKRERKPFLDSDSTKYLSYIARIIHLLEFYNKKLNIYNENNAIGIVSHPNSEIEGPLLWILIHKRIESYVIYSRNYSTHIRLIKNNIVKPFLDIPN